MIYIDNPKWTRASAKNPRKQYSHMVSDISLEELHQFALWIGVKPHFFHNSNIKHYDISGEEINKAIAAGATLVGSKELVKIGKNIK